MAGRRASSPTTAPPTRRRGSSCSRPRSAGSRTPTRAAGDWLARALDRGGGLVRHATRLVAGADAAGLAGHARPDRGVRRRHPAAGRHRARAAPGRPRLPGRGLRRAAGARRRRRHPPARLVGRSCRRPAGAAVGARARRHGGRGGGPRGAGGRVAARLAAVGGRARAGGARRRRRAAVPARHPHRLRPAHPVERVAGVRAARLPPRLGVAVRLVARLGRPARRGPRRGGRARPRRRPRRARPARPRAGAVRGE